MFGPEPSARRTPKPHRYAVGDEVQDKQANQYTVLELTWYQERWGVPDATYRVTSVSNGAESTKSEWQLW